MVLFRFAEFSSFSTSNFKVLRKYRLDNCLALYCALYIVILPSVATSISICVLFFRLGENQVSFVTL